METLKLVSMILSNIFNARKWEFISILHQYKIRTHHYISYELFHSPKITITIRIHAYILFLTRPLLIASKIVLSIEVLNLSKVMLLNILTKSMILQFLVAYYSFQSKGFWNCFYGSIFIRNLIWWLNIYY